MQSTMRRLVAAGALLLALILAGQAHADARLDATVRSSGLWANTSSYTPPVYELWQTSSPCAASFTTPFAPLTAQLAGVELPCYFTPSLGTDGEAVVRDYANHRTTETWVTSWTGSQWSARWGGSALDSEFVQTPYGRQWPRPGGSNYGVQAAGLAFTPGIITVDDLRNGIGHAIHFAVPYSCRSFVWPATRTDGNAKADGTWDCYRLGTVWKLPASFAIPASWPLVLRRIAQAAKTYGMVASDSTADTVAFRFENWRRPWSSWGAGATPTDPYQDPAGLDLFGCRTAGDWSCVLDNNNRGRALLDSGFWRDLEVVPAP